MNYRANTKHWRPGDFVIHDADAKRADMLMVVVRYEPDGRCVTQYAVESRHRIMPIGHEYVFEPRFLHNPARFGIPLPAAAEMRD